MNVSLLIQKLAAIVAAHDVLKGPDQRAAYDRTLAPAVESVKAPLLEYRLELSLLQFYVGGSVPVQFPRRNKCASCAAVHSERCTACKGQHGGFVLSQSQLNVEITPGAADGWRLLFAGQGHQGPGPAGDVMFTLESLPDPRHMYIRQGDDLHVSVSCAAEMMLTGFESQIAQIDGRFLVVPVGPGQASVSTPLQVANEGFPLKADGAHSAQPRRGLMFVHFVLPSPPQMRAELEDDVWMQQLSAALFRDETPGPKCRGMVTRPIGHCTVWKHSYGERCRWDCCGSHARIPTHHF